MLSHGYSGSHSDSLLMMANCTLFLACPFLPLLHLRRTDEMYYLSLWKIHMVQPH